MSEPEQPYAPPSAEVEDQRFDPTPREEERHALLATERLLLQLGAALIPAGILGGVWGGRPR